jgi:hypothetical protein
MPVTSLKRGRVPAAVQPHKIPAPKAPSPPPPDRGQEDHFGLKLVGIGGHLLVDRLKGALLQVFTVDVAPVPDAGQGGHLDLVQEVLRQRMAYRKRHAAMEE